MSYVKLYRDGWRCAPQVQARIPRSLNCAIMDLRTFLAIGGEMGFDPFKWRKRGIASLKGALEEQMPTYVERDERVVASMLGQTHPSAIGTELVVVGGPLHFKTGFRYLYLAATQRHLYLFALDQFRPKNIKKMLGKVELGTVPIEVSGGALKIGDVRIIASTGEKAAVDQVAAAAQGKASTTR
jgi:hypothetical protein